MLLPVLDSMVVVRRADSSETLTAALECQSAIESCTSGGISIRQWYSCGPSRNLDKSFYIVQRGWRHCMRRFVISHYEYKLPSSSNIQRRIEQFSFMPRIAIAYRENSLCTLVQTSDVLIKLTQRFWIWMFPSSGEMMAKPLLSWVH
jgi:hypothetical protein